MKWRIFHSLLTSRGAAISSMLLRNSTRTLAVAKLTEHAKLKMRESNIRLSDVLLTVEKPSMVLYDTIYWLQYCFGTLEKQP